MHLHSLSIAAIGPFPGQHDINFAELGAGGIFLLEGPTGSGKSTIIDAIVFALYGKVASKGASEERLRSTHVGPETESSVDLVFETGHGIYRILRRPAYDRPSKRGSGTVRQNMQVQLWRLNSPEALHSGEQLSTRADEVGAEVTRLVGLSREQFVQTIVLPQGEFANFLSAKPEERRGLLQRVFGTEIYERIQEELIAARRQADRDIGEARSNIRSAVDNFAGAADITRIEADELTALVEATKTEQVETAVAAHLTKLNTAATETAAVATKATAVSDTARTAEQAAKVLLETVQKRDDLTKRSAALHSANAQYEKNLGEHSAAIKAGHVTGYLDAAERAEQALATANTALSTAIAAAPWLEPERIDGAQGLADWQPDTGDPVPGLEILEQPLLAEPAHDLPAAISERQTQITNLNRAADLEKKLPARKKEHTKRESARQTRSAEHDTLAKNLDKRPAERTELETLRSTALHKALAIAGLKDRLDDANTAHSNATAANKTAEKLAKIDARVEKARTAAHDGETQLTQLRRARIDGIAGELAANLSDGEACAVCGSTTHPAPATVGDDHVTPEAVTEAEEASRTLTQKLSDMAAQRTELAMEHAKHLAGARQQSVAETEMHVAEVSAELELATAAEQKADELKSKLTEFDATTTTLQREHTTEGNWLASEKAALQGLADAISAERAEIDATIRNITAAAPETTDPEPDSPDVRELISTRTDEIKALSDVIESLADRRRALTESDRARTDVGQALIANDFTGSAAARAAARSKTAVDALTASIKKHEAEQTLVTTGLADKAVASLSEEVTSEQAQADADLAHKTAQDAAAHAREANQTASDKEGIRTRANTAATDITKELTSSAALLENLAPTLRIAKLAEANSSDNTSGLTLGTYVLTRRFEEVLDAANSRLREMSSGRYELQRSSEKETHGGRKLGLALTVVDHNTESSRDPATLSGGETFYVSLCLALGLADIVTAEAGGVDLGTLFVDEGFGSLDPETLDLVMAELGKLRAGGRMVGVVSHVEAMKSTISDRISVRRQQGGSSTLKVLAGTS